MTEKKPEEKAAEKKNFYCEVCRCKVANMDATKTDYMHCGRKMTPLEVAYMSDPSPTGA